MIRKVLSLFLAVAMTASMFGTVVYAEQSDTVRAAADAKVIDFTAMQSVPIYSKESGEGFVSESAAIMQPKYERKVAPTKNITISAENGASVTESTGSYIKNDSNYKSYGGLIYRIDVPAGAYSIEVEVGGSSADTKVAPTGMNAEAITATVTWDNPGLVPIKTFAAWNGSVWTYDYASGNDFVEIDIEPALKPSETAPQTVSVKKITLTPIEVGAKGDKPTIHILGDSTQKAYTFNEVISSWGQTLRNYFDLSKVNVINYSMGGRCMRNNYTEGRTNDALVNGKAGDFVFIHSAHNDETSANSRFDRGLQYGTLDENNALYDKWLDMYVNAIKARGMIPVLVSPMPRGSGKPSEKTDQPNGFNPDSPGRMRAKAASDPEVGYVELYKGAKEYVAKLGSTEGQYIYNNTEAGETPAENSANGAGGDGTHYKEAAAKQWCRIMLQSMYDQSVAATDTYTDKAIMQELVSYMPASVTEAAASGNWSAVFPEMASDVSAVGVVPGAAKQSEANYYYRNNIEKVLQLGALHKDSKNLFKPGQTVTVGDFARGMETVFGLEKNSLTSYNKTYAEIIDSGVMSAAAEPFASDNVVLSEPSVNAAADGQYTITVQQPEQGVVTIYNESAKASATADIPAGVKASQVIADNKYFKLTAPAQITQENKSVGDAFSDNKEISTNCILFRNSKPEAIVTYEAKADGIMTVYASAASNKPIECVGSSNTQSGNVSGPGKVNFNVTAGETYKLWTRGGTGYIFGVKYESTDFPQSTESLTVNANDQVKIAAKPNENYINKSIIVNGKSVAEGGSYMLKVTGDATVTADFRHEPALVSETIIASDAALTREAMGAILYDAYLAAYGKNDDGSWNKVPYMNQNGSIPSPDDPNYDPNIKYEGSPYIPLVGWGALEDIDKIDTRLYQKVKEAYNLGLMRSEKGAKRGSITSGSEIEPKTEVTRAKAAKELMFCYILTQPLKGESQLIPGGINHAAETADIAVPNTNAPSVPVWICAAITSAALGDDGKLSVQYTLSEGVTSPKLCAAIYADNAEQELVAYKDFTLSGSGSETFDFTAPTNGKLKLFIWDGLDSMNPLSLPYSAEISAPVANVSAADTYGKYKFDVSIMREIQRGVVGDKSFMLSPISIKTAFAMAANGAEGETKSEMLDTLGIEDLNAYNAEIKRFMARLEENRAYNERINNVLWYARRPGDKLVLDMANSIWLNKDYYPNIDDDFSDEFKAATTDYYSAEANTVGRADAVDTINGWISDKTNGKIKDMISSNDFWSCLVNAIYMKASWSEPFRDSNTDEQDFTTKTGKTKTVDMMHRIDYIDYYSDDELSAVRLPYEGGASMYVVLTDGNEASNVLKHTNEFAEKYVSLSLPKFTTEYKEDNLVSAMESLGIHKAFSMLDAEFGKMGKNVPEPLYIGQALHQSYIGVDEKGTEAAAATVIMIAPGAAPGGEIKPTPIDFTADRPFSYFIVDNATGYVLFMGAYNGD